MASRAIVKIKSPLAHTHARDIKAR